LLPCVIYGMKECSKCNELKDLSCFVKDKRMECGYRSQCKECANKRRRELYDPEKESIRAKEKYQNNKEQFSLKAKKYYLDNKETILLRNKEWAKNNPEKTKAIRSKPENKKRRQEYKRQWKREKYANDTLYKLSDCIRCACYRVTQAVKQQKELHSLEYLGCSLEEFKTHIESLWLDGMTWENHGIDGWHIDHKIPLDYFVKNEDDPWKANHYSNLQPLWAEDNIRKGNSI